MGPELRRLGVLHGPLRFLTVTGEPVAVEDDPPEVIPEGTDPHALSNAELLRLVHARLTEDRSVTQPERAELARLAGLILSRLGGLIGR